MVGDRRFGAELRRANRAVKSRSHIGGGAVAGGGGDKRPERIELARGDGCWGGQGGFLPGRRLEAAESGRGSGGGRG